jgi:hypothetical protein
MADVTIREVEAALAQFRPFNDTLTYAYSPDQIIFVNISSLNIFLVIPSI